MENQYLLYMEVPVEKLSVYLNRFLVTAAHDGTYTLCVKGNNLSISPAIDDISSGIPVVQQLDDKEISQQWSFNRIFTLGSVLPSIITGADVTKMVSILFYEDYADVSVIV